MSSLPRIVAGLATVGTVAGSFVGIGAIQTTPAYAAELNATGGSLQWGIKSSLLAYHFKHMGMTQSLMQGDGATPSTATTNTPDGPIPASWTFPFVSGSFDSGSKKYVAQYGGYVELKETNPAPAGNPSESASPFKYLKFAKPKVTVDLGSGTKTLTLEITAATNGAAQGSPQTVVFATFPDLATASDQAGGSVTYSALNTAMTAAGTALFPNPSGGSFYTDGEPLDAVTSSLTGLGGTTTDPSASPSPSSSSSTDTGGGTTASGSSTTTTTTDTGGSSSTGTASNAPTQPYFMPPGYNPNNVNGVNGGNGVNGVNGTVQPPQGPGMFGYPVAPSRYQPPPWFTGPPPPPPQLQQQPQQQYYAAPPANQVPATVQTPVTAAPETQQVAATTDDSTPADFRSRTAPRVADADEIAIGVTGTEGTGDTGGAILLLVMAAGAGIAFVSTRHIWNALLRAAANGVSERR